VFAERTSVGLDVHARSVAAAAIDGRTGEVFRARLTPSYGQVLEWINGLPGPCAVVYEAGPTGNGLARALSRAGLRYEVAASSKCPHSWLRTSRLRQVVSRDQPGPAFGARPTGQSSRVPPAAAVTSVGM